jgi:hypothetical protein
MKARPKGRSTVSGSAELFGVLSARYLPCGMGSENRAFAPDWLLKFGLRSLPDNLLDPAPRGLSQNFFLAIVLPRT